MIEYQYRKNIYLLLIIAVGFLLAQYWMQESRSGVPEQFQKSLPVVAPKGHPQAKQALAPMQLISVSNDVLRLWINPRGGSVVRADLLRYKKNLSGDALVSVLGLNSLGQQLSASQVWTDMGAVLYRSSATAYKLLPGKNTITVTLRGTSSKGLAVEKRFVLHKGGYAVQSTVAIKNVTNRVYRGHPEMRLDRKTPGNMAKYRELLGYPAAKPKRVDPSLWGRFQAFFGTFNAFRSFSGFAYYTKDKPYTKLSDASLAQNNGHKVRVNGGWIADQVPYFITAWVPEDAQQPFTVVSQETKGVKVLKTTGDPVVLRQGQSAKMTSVLYAGPELSNLLERLAPGLNLTVDYGILWVVAHFLYMILQYIHKVVPNWGWDIILLTLSIRLVLFKFSGASFRSTVTMKLLQPKMEAIKSKYANDSQKQRKAISDLYVKEKVNPIGGCLPNLLTLPVFFALYFLLIETVELRHAPFMFWIQDLSARDPYFVLPVLYGVSMWFQQRVNPPTPGMAQEVMALLPFIMILMFSAFPVGLILYMVTNNAFMIIHNWLVNRDMGVYDGDFKGPFDFSFLRPKLPQAKQ